jgi:16S rRNA (guanine966-N2)-methyltransferase
MGKYQHRSRRHRRPTPSSASAEGPSEVRIIGGRMRGRKLSVSAFQSDGDRITRPMKDRVREAIYNLIGTELTTCHAIDLFAGTGALGLEALSRGAHSATFIERHVPTARVLEENIDMLGVQSQCKVHTTSAFLWVKRDLANAECGMRNAELDQVDRSALRQRSWLVFCSPPYSFYVERADAMLELLGRIMHHAPDGSLLVVEADERFDLALLPGGPISDKRDTPWQVRAYPPAVVAVWRK